ncbi:MAG: 23S rRNA (guanosine(2251)-2'-O)-methyltransferase RlmB [Alphaproteobacteria bacterium]|nr:23S rRNA (guanosine(2251)-2'-O)-methyltransferase RlmB [Alphaproteobacteria bacterium]MBT5828063.1 23S rRNA (guanosine(2251)-2'-O)-methyltransferase RlmB [Alphaproteobacteria bacterium]
MSDNLWVYGINAVKELVNVNKRKILQVLITEKNFYKYQNQPEFVLLFKQKIRQINFKDFNKYFVEQVNHQGIAVEISKPTLFQEQNLLENITNIKQLVVLDQITDVGNIGAIIRSMVAFGFNDLIVTEHNSVSDYGHLLKASAGMSEHLNIYKITNLTKLLNKIKPHDFWLAGLDGNAKNDVSYLKKYEKIALILGSEGKGIRSLVKKNLDLMVSIPISSKVESLNVSNAAAISFYALHN